MRYKSCNCIFCNCSHSEDNPITKDHIPSLRKGRCCYRSGYILKVQYMATSVTTGKRWIVGFVKDDLSRVMGILGRCKFAGETFHGFCEAPGGFCFSALIWHWGSIHFNRCLPVIREVRWWQFHAKWDASLRKSTNSSIRQGVSNSLRTTIKFTTRSRCLTQEINSSILQSVSNSLWTIIKFTTMSRWLTLEINSSIRQGVVDSLGHLSNLQQGGRWLTHYFHLYVIN